ncbi:glycosyltransferase [Actinomyces succiniciruminis]|uniref:Glycosyltransferase n=1 Tax=Actinomyces succiniciruminis TaxID=1522002 RepID=A0A1L7RM78_9ACTO|nr:glycosyltransferase [Actinomyces succiniciruminis]CED90173.1 Glycosyltransferase [Actinomyces succiniciruminis]
MNETMPADTAVTRTAPSGAPVPGGSALRLPTFNGRGPRVAMLVYNDAHNDARVLKEAAALRAAGATVRIFAVARANSGYPEGTVPVSDGVDIVRAREFALANVSPRLAALRDRVTGKTGAPTGAEALKTPAASGAGTEPQGTPALADGTAAVPASATDTAQVETARAHAPRPTITTAAHAAADRAGALTADAAMRAYKTVSLGDYWLRAARAALAWMPDVVHANDGNTLAPALWIVDRCHARLVYDSHELWLHRNVRTDRPVARKVEAAVEKRGIRRADAVITVSPSIVDWLTEHYRLETPPALVRNIPAAGPLPDPGRGRLHELAGLAPTDKVIAYGGRITTSRGIEETIAALPHLPADVHLVMLGYGEPDYLAVVAREAARHGVSDRVHRVGPVAPHEVADALSDADVAVVHVRPTCLSYRFALPNKLFESIRGGLPVAAADLPDIRAVVERYGVGEVFSGEDPADLAATISHILADPDRYRAAALAACPQLTWEQETGALIGAYRRALMGERA